MTKYRHGVRIIGGRLKSRKIIVPDLPELRPTADRVRETLFNWLDPVVDRAVCLDVFAGSGALALEALSRGACRAVAVDSRRSVVAALEQSRLALGLEDSALEIVHDRAERFLSRAADRRFDIVFIDPPFDTQVQGSVCDLLERNGWLRDDALVYVESERGNEPACPPGWVRLKQGRAGIVSYELLRA